LAKGKTRTGRLWTYVRDDRPFGGPDPPAAVFFYSIAAASITARREAFAPASIFFLNSTVGEQERISRRH
jgi:hypothetical protein